MSDLTGVVGELIPIAGIIWLGFIIWAGLKRREREAFYRSELLKKIIDSPSGSAQNVMEMLRQEERAAKIRRREGLKLAGVIIVAAGIGLAIFLARLNTGNEPVWLVGVLTLLVGAALLIYVRFMAPPVD
jgi:hypothetical protein